MAVLALFLPSAGLVPVRALAATEPGHPAWLTSKKQAFDTAKKEKKLVVFDAFAKWCGWCKRLDKDVLDTPRFVDATKKGFVLLRLDTEDNKDGTEMASRYRISNLPTTVVFDENEVVVGRIAGYVKYDDFMGYLNRFVKSYEEIRTRDGLAEGSKKGDVDFLFSLAGDWQGRENPTRALQLFGRVVDSKKASAEQRARAAYGAGVCALMLGKLDEADKRLRQLDRVTPFPEAMDGMPELLRSDIAASRGDLDTAISVLEALLDQGDPSAAWRGNLPGRIAELKNLRRLREVSPRPRS
jgi:thioredoxin-related protein